MPPRRRKTRGEQSVAELKALVQETGVDIPDTLLNFDEIRAKKTRERKIEAAALRLAGMSVSQIAERQGTSVNQTHELLRRVDAEPVKDSLKQMRELENLRLDRAQAAIWGRVLAGDDKAIDVFLRISARRAKLNGLDEPTKIDLSIGVRQEMERALDELQNVVLGQVISTHDDVQRG